ncbi:hypothetical protein [Micromonospora peucetia]|uniref:Uncharacterized protein n=1 Tax=Micromonospora peucetia TaxID=47871 RepID=A0A1C6VLI5_9ACTN|nr:hypothetical protein [Micromonospora peucetia]WSA30570.1 hypothetical protein OIE14_20585 [Micromonospora peucetia]SCL67183.1 hypothetical protein GA0070608_3452 [Micromonospora peucetia]
MSSYRDSAPLYDMFPATVGADPAGTAPTPGPRPTPTPPPVPRPVPHPGPPPRAGDAGQRA